MTAATVHRIIEQHAATRGSGIAISDAGRVMTYRDLNFRANMLARRLQASGVRRGAHATVTMAPGADLAVTLLAILKLGGCYTWMAPEPFGSEPVGVSVAVSPGAETSDARYLHLELTAALAETPTCSPNLPIGARGTDTACVLRNADGSDVFVPHATIVALAERALPREGAWGTDPAAFDLWMPLMAGSTAVVENRRASAAVAA